jgi:hypothetical protein
VGLFRRNTRSEPASGTDQREVPDHDSDIMSPVVGLLASRYPSATPEQLGYMSELIVTMEAQRGAGAGWEPRQVAAISTLCERLVSDDPALAGFVTELRTIAEQASASDPADASWRAMVRHL